MPTASRTEHKTTVNTALPYISNSSILSVSPQWTTGSQNLLTGLLQRTERRPGFSEQFVPPPSGGWHNLTKQFLWRRWTAAFFWMGCDISGGQALVYKFQIGSDTVPVLLWTSASAEPFDFVVSNNTCYFGNGTDMKKYDGTTLNNWGFAAPAAGPSLTLITGTLNAYTSKCYCYTYWDGKHESSPSDISACSGLFTSKNVQLGVVASADTQVTGIRVYATPDGGSQDPSLMQEITGSPFPNVTGNVVDSTLDADLSIRTAPPFYRNDPPPPSKGFVVYGGRLWGFLNNVTYYSAFEETPDLVPEECWPSGLDGNAYPWANEVTAHAALLDGIAIFQPERISKVEGDSLDTFRRYTLLERRGTRNRHAVASLGGSVAWFDTAGQVWVSDIGEVGLPIRPDTAPIDQTQVEIEVHVSGIYHWIVLLDGATGQLFVYDLDQKQWMPPWTIGTTASGLVSGETSIGVVDLLVTRNQTKALKLVSGTYTDDTTPYASVASSNMYQLAPGSTLVSPSVNVAWKGVHDYTEIKTDTNPPTKVEQISDEDPMQGTWTDITANAIATPDIIQGKFLQSWRYGSNYPTAQFLALRFSWPALAQNFKLYQLTTGYHQFGE